MSLIIFYLLNIYSSQNKIYLIKTIENELPIIVDYLKLILDSEVPISDFIGIRKFLF